MLCGSVWLQLHPVPFPLLFPSSVSAHFLLRGAGVEVGLTSAVCFPRVRPLPTATWPCTPTSLRRTMSWSSAKARCTGSLRSARTAGSRARPWGAACPGSSQGTTWHLFPGEGRRPGWRSLRWGGRRSVAGGCWKKGGSAFKSLFPWRNFPVAALFIADLGNVICGLQHQSHPHSQTWLVMLEDGIYNPRLYKVWCAQLLLSHRICLLMILCCYKTTGLTPALNKASNACGLLCSSSSSKFCFCKPLWNNLQAEEIVHECVPSCFTPMLQCLLLAGKHCHGYAHLSFRATLGLQMELTPSQELSVPPHTCTESPPSLGPFQRKAPHHTESVDLEKSIQVCSIFSLREVCKTWTGQDLIKFRADEKMMTKPADSPKKKKKH